MLWLRACPFVLSCAVSQPQHSRGSKSTGRAFSKQLAQNGRHQAWHSIGSSFGILFFGRASLHWQFVLGIRWQSILLAHLRWQKFVAFVREAVRSASRSNFLAFHFVGPFSFGTRGDSGWCSACVSLAPHRPPSRTPWARFARALQGGPLSRFIRCFPGLILEGVRKNAFSALVSTLVF